MGQCISFAFRDHVNTPLRLKVGNAWTLKTCGIHTAPPSRVAVAPTNSLWDRLSFQQLTPLAGEAGEAGEAEPRMSGRQRTNSRDRLEPAGRREVVVAGLLMQKHNSLTTCQR